MQMKYASVCFCGNIVCRNGFMIEADVPKQTFLSTGLVKRPNDGMYAFCSHVIVQEHTSIGNALLYYTILKLHYHT